MKLLLDSCVSRLGFVELRASGHDVEWVGEWNEDPGDEEVLKRAHAARRVLVTLDKDFGELAIVRGTAHSGIIRLISQRSTEQAPLVQAVVEKYGTELESGAIVTVESERVRVRPQESNPE